MGRGFESLPRYHTSFQTIPVNARKPRISGVFLYMADLNDPARYSMLPHMNVGLMWG